LGLFAKRAMPRDYRPSMCYYEGQLITYEEALQLKNSSKDSHVLQLVGLRDFIDGFKSPNVDKNNGKSLQGVASMVNTLYDKDKTTRKFNSKFLWIETGTDKLTKECLIALTNDVCTDEELVAEYKRFDDPGPASSSSSLLLRSSLKKAEATANKVTAVAPANVSKQQKRKRKSDSLQERAHSLIVAQARRKNKKN
jgi:hypothetical protein